MVAAMKVAVILSLLLYMCQVRGSHITPKMKEAIGVLLKHYKISRTEKFSGKTVISRDLLVGRMEGRKVFMGGVLEVYEKLIGHMLNQLPTPSPQTDGGQNGPASTVTAGPETASNIASIRTELNYILEKVQKLRKHSYQEEDKILQGLQALKHIQMDNHVIQSKALGELTWLYEEASSLPQAMQRRRRHTRRDKAHPRA